MTNRRTLLCAGSAIWLSSPVNGFAQPTTGKRRVAYLGVSSPNPITEQFELGLKDLGWLEGKNLILDTRWAQGDPARYQSLTSELLALKPDVFVSATDYAVRAAAAATKSVPIVFIYGTDPVGGGLVKSLARPGGNVTGYDGLAVELEPKRLSMLKEAIPGLSKVCVFVGSSERAQASLKNIEQAGRKVGVHIESAVIDRIDDIAGAFDAAVRFGAMAVMDATLDIATFAARQRVAATAIERRLPMLVPSSSADDGGLMSYGVDFLALFRRGAVLVDRILKGAKPADIPVERVSVYELVINRRTARALGIELPRSLMFQATRLID